MVRSSRWDRWLAALWAPLWLLCFVLAFDAALVAVGRPSFMLAVDAAGSCPRVIALTDPSLAARDVMRVGDGLCRIDDFDMRGAGPIEAYVPLARYSGPGHHARLALLRDGHVVTAMLPVTTYRPYWPRVAASFVFAAVAMLLLLRKPNAVSRAVAHSFMATAIFLVCTFSGSMRSTWFAVIVHLASLAFVLPLSLRASLLFPKGLAPSSRAITLGPWLFSGLVFFEGARFYDLFLPVEVGALGMSIGDSVFFVLLLALSARSYRNASAIERRQLKWVVLATYLAITLPLVAVWLASSLEYFPLLVISMASLALIPLAFLIAIRNYNLFDIDRLIGITAAYTVLAVAAIAASILGVPALARVSTAALGLEAETSDVLGATGAAALVVVLQPALQRGCDRLLFAERFRLHAQLGALLRDLGAGHEPAQLLSLVVQRLSAVVQPECCVMYGLRDRAFVPIAASDGALPLPLPQNSGLVGVIETMHSVETSFSLRSACERFGLVEERFVTALGHPVIGPVRRDGALVGLVTLGSKRSGDVYSSTDLALLAAICDKVGSELLRFDERVIAQHNETLRQRLRRYVPGALAGELERGRELGASSCEVSVMFVDMRGYTRYAESRSPHEIFALISRYTRHVSEIVVSHGGTVVEFNGDGMMAIFGAPQPLPDKEAAAVTTAIEIISLFEAGSSTGSYPLSDLAVGVGIATGEAFVGSIQAHDRAIWSALGDTTNLAARLQQLTRQLGVYLLIDSTTQARASTLTLAFAKHAGLYVRGRKRPEDVFAMGQKRSFAALTEDGQLVANSMQDATN
jgi:class 3 adenylate cyclase